MNKSIIFIYAWIFYIFWIFINNILNNLITSLLVLLFLVVLFLLLYYLTKKFIEIFIFCVITFLIWITISDLNIKSIENKIYIIDKNIENSLLEIEIKSVFKIDENQKSYIWKILKIDWIVINKNIKWEIYIKWNFKLEKWTVITTKSKIYKYKSFNWFDYDKYMIANWYYFKIFPKDYTILTKNKINSLESKIIDFREFLLSTIKEIYPEQEAIFLWWILLWAREELPKELKENFNNSWLTHFIAVSWFNITILVIFFSYIIKIFPWFIRSIIITIAIVWFTFLVWFTAPVIRASIMWLIWYYVITSWRQWNILSIIILTLIIMVTYSPYSINYDVSLHLSFLAVLWIIYTNDFFEKKLWFLTNILEIRTALSLTLWAFSLTLPIMIVNFWQLSIIAPISNILVAWTIPLAMLLWFLSIIFYQLIPIIWIIIWYFAYLLLRWDILIVNVFWSSSWSIISFNLWFYKDYLSILYFLILIFIIIWFKKSK